ncbi:DUF1648 domain-containing protein [Lacticaseibacillus sp. N501-2]|uniref:DUF1648 domain-containing protein n=1 Tax=Lacticaseibacillus salsurae TaxID=3367729 RepID=UPI0038B3BB95
MTKNKWVLMAITSAIILATMGFGVSQYDALPAMMVTHWGIDNQPNGWMPKAMAVFGIPLIMLAAHWFTMGVTYLADVQGKGAPRLERVLVWFFPAMTLVLYTVTIRYALHQPVNIRLWAMVVISAAFIVIGNYLPTAPLDSSKTGWVGFGYHVPWTINNQAGVLKSARVLGYVMVAGGILILATLLLPPVASAVALGIVVAAIIVTMPLSYVWTSRPANK